ncbi:dihydropteroate synthase [Anianabacter salinae]|uniref:dihydropteroate synthase n=1 Tax=Anianabacter salinae TaxID=2851023 RepID=UPI00225E7006|nr:dihydropteroate synthase [Anianabacter salinae]MBV0913976.1 dihydropteroate synthase [Anianabacter salinae]
MSPYYRPIPSTDPARPEGALTLAGGWCWFDRAEVLERGRAPVLIPASDLPPEVAMHLTAPRAPLVGLSMDAPRIMAILNVTPDSFSDGGVFNAKDAALNRARVLAEEGADILDVGGESTRPGADVVEIDEETERTAPLILAIRSQLSLPISIDTRKAPVARAALAAGADMVNDVAAFTHDPHLAGVVAETGVPVCLMHAKGDPKTMQQAPDYDDVLLDVYDFLAARVAAAEAAGLARDAIVIDPGIGFGKTLEHNLTLLQRLSLFHALGCPILLGASRKRFIGTLGHEPEPAQRGPGSIAVALAGIAQGVQIVRVHDMKQTRQALHLERAIRNAGASTQ